jgi:hypothetical protein
MSDSSAEPFPPWGPALLPICPGAGGAVHVVPPVATPIHLLPMDVSMGHGGWFRFAGPDEPLTYVPFAADEVGRWVVVELYTAGDPAAALTKASLDYRVDTLEAFANRPDIRDALKRDRTPGPDLRRLASHFATTWGKPTHWVAQSYFAPFPESDVPQAPMGREPRRIERQRDVPTLRTPPEGLTDEFLNQVAKAY